MKSFGTNAVYGFLGGAIAAAVWSMVTNYLRFGYVPIDPLLFAAALTGCTYGFVHATIHWVGGFRPTLVSSIGSAVATLACGVVLSLWLDMFVGWSLISVASLMVFAGLIGWLTHIFATEF